MFPLFEDNLFFFSKKDKDTGSFKNIFKFLYFDIFWKNSLRK